jgi:predicted DNA binding protein
MQESPHVMSYLTAGEEFWMAVSQFEPTDGVRRALELQRESSLVVETPIQIRSGNDLKVTFIGTDETFSELYERTEQMEHISIEILEMGDYEADKTPFNRMFTSRQEEVLKSAVDLGYYREPRQASLEDIGEAVGISPGTVGEHLRKAEERVFSELVQ